MTRLVRGFVVAAILAALAPGAPTAQSNLESRIPSPESVMEFAPCSDYKLATYEQIADYFRKLDAATERLQLIEIGKTVEGRPQLLAIISAEPNLRNLARYKEMSQRLALVRGLTDGQARALAHEGKAVVWIDFGLHSNEVAHGQTAPLMAYRVATEESEEMRFIRDNVIVLLVPNMNPDGTTLVASWYMNHVGKPWDLSPPELYHKYAGHDNNRDWFMFNMPETRNVGRQVYTEWLPQIVHDQHQIGPFPARIFIPPFDDPMNPNIPPLVVRGVNEVGAAMARRFDREGKSGVVSRVQFDTWWNGGMRTTPYFHNMVGILTETGHSSPAPAVYDAKTFPKTFANGESTLEPSTFYPSPFKGGEWHLRDSCEYMITASMAVLDIGAKRRSEWLYDIYRMGRDAIHAGADELYVIPAAQWDPGTAAKLINVLRWGAVEVERATQPFRVGDATYPAGSYVIRGAQPFRAYLTDLLTPQRYPERRLYPGGPPDQPYDITGWTLSYQMGVRVDRYEGPVARVPEAGFEQVEWAVPPAGAVAGAAAFAYAFDPRANDSVIAVNRLLQVGEIVYRTGGPVGVNGAEWPAGTFLVLRGPSTSARAHQAARTLGLQVGTVDAAPTGEAWRLRPPRVGLYHGWGGNMDEGWTRWLLEQFEFPFTSVHDADIRAGNLGAKFDVLLLPDASYARMLSGLAPGTMPPEYTDGMTPKGIAHLYEFTATGGTLVAMDGASELPLTAFGLPLRDVTRGLPEADFSAPGTLLRVNIDPTHPVAYGMPGEAAAFFIRSPAFTIARPRTAMEEWTGVPGREPTGIRVVAEYPRRDVLLSGWLLGERVLAGRAAVVEATVGKGRTVLLGFRTQHRGQPHGTFKLLFNAIYLGAAEREPMSKTTSTNPRK